MARLEQALGRPASASRDGQDAPAGGPGGAGRGRDDDPPSAGRGVGGGGAGSAAEVQGPTLQQLLKEVCEGRRACCRADAVE